MCFTPDSFYCYVFRFIDSTVTNLILTSPNTSLNFHLFENYVFDTRTLIYSVAFYFSSHSVCFLKHVKHIYNSLLTSLSATSSISVCVFVLIDFFFRLVMGHIVCIFACLIVFWTLWFYIIFCWISYIPLNNGIFYFYAQWGHLKSVPLFQVLFLNFVWIGPDQTLG